MEIANINDLVNNNVKKEFYIKTIPVDNFSSNIGALNVIDFDKTKLLKIEAFISDITFSQFFNSSILDNDSKYTIIFNGNMDFVGKIVFLIDAINNKEIFIIDNINQTCSPTNFEENVYVLTGQKIDDFSNSKKIDIVFIENIDKLNIAFKDSFLIQKIQKSKNNGEVHNLDIKASYLPMIVNPIEVDNLDTKYYFHSLARFSIFDIRALKVGSNFAVLDISDDYKLHQYHKLLKKIKTIIKNQNLIFAGLNTLSEKEKEEFKEKIYAGNKPEEYVDYALSLLFGEHESTDYGCSIEEIKTVILMCSEWLKSSYCVDSGFTQKHKYLLPFYFDYNNGQFYLRSEFFDISFNDKGELVLSNKPKKFRALQKIEYADIPLELKETQASYDYKDFSVNNFKYKVNLLLDNRGQKFKDLYQFLFIDRDKLINEKYVIEDTQVKTKVLNFFYEKTGYNWNEASESTLEDYVYKTFGYHLRKNSIRYRKKRVSITLHKRFSHDLLAQNKNISFNKVNNDIWWKDDKTLIYKEQNVQNELNIDESEEWLTLNDIQDLNTSIAYVGKIIEQKGNHGSSYSQNITIQICEVKYVIDKTKLLTENQNNYEHTRYFYENDFVLNKSDFRKLTETFSEIEPLNLEVFSNEKIIIKGMCFPSHIYLNENKHKLRSIHNLGQLHITFNK